MKKFCLALVLLACSAFSLAENRPTDASVRELLQVMQTKKMLDSQMGQMDALFDSVLKPVTPEGKITPEQQQVMETLKGKLSALIKAEMSWDVLEPMTIEIYLNSFNQSEIDSMLTFYKSPAGQAVIEKMPVVMQNTMQLMQKRLEIMLQKIQQLTEESIQQMHATPKTTEMCTPKCPPAAKKSKVKK